MALPDSIAFLASIPDGFHVRAKSVTGEVVDGVMVSPSDEPTAGDYGMTIRASSIVYVASPFACPRSFIEISRDKGETWERRHVDSVQDNIVFLAIGIGTEG